MNSTWKTCCVIVLLMPATALADVVNRRVFLFAGQSNMAGADALVAGTGAQDLVGAGLQTDADRSALFTYSLGFNAGNVPTYPVNSPGYGWGDIRGHMGSSFSQLGYSVIGPEVGFNRALYAHGVRDAAIIAVSNNINTLGPPWPWTNRIAPNNYYAQWSSFVNARLAELTSHGDTYTIAGFVWDQGIDDAILGSTQAQYQANLTNLITQLRTDYGTPTTPFVLVTSKSTMANPTYMAAVRAAQVAVAEADPYAAWVTSDDLPNVNTHHFSADSQLVIGQRLGDAYLALSVPEPSSATMLLAIGLAIGRMAGTSGWRRRRTSSVTAA
jgi:hypothetical protein